MTMTEPQIDPGMAEDVKDRQREGRGDQTPDFDLPEADLAPDPTAPAEMTPQDKADLIKLEGNAAVPAALDDRENKIAVARATAKQASAAMDGLTPGSAAEKQNLEAMRAARREGNPVVEGLQTQDDEQHSTHPAGEKKSWFKKLLGLN